jgi:hypothetical protein
MKALQRDPRIKKIYTTYLEQWEKRVDDVMVLYSQTWHISKFGGWRLRECADQPTFEAPK